MSLRKELELSKVGKEKTYRKVAHAPGVKVFVGTEAGSPSLLVATVAAPSGLPSIAGFEISVNQRSQVDRDWTTKFVLRANESFEIFCLVCEDLILSMLAHPGRATEVMVSRLDHWRRFLASKRTLGHEELMGLLGELSVLHSLLDLNPDRVEEVLEGWKGPHRGCVDFLYSTLHVEVKATKPDSSSVKISSIEQLEPPPAGIRKYLHVREVELFDPSDIGSGEMTASDFIDGFRKRLVDASDALALFDACLNSIGCRNDEPQLRRRFRFGAARSYEVNADFPGMRRSQLGVAVVRATYDISLVGVAAFLAEGDFRIYVD